MGKDVYVESDSKYYYRLKNLDQELGGGINIVTITKDSLITEDLIRMVDRGEIPLTVVDSDIAELNKSYYPRLDIGMKISLDQFSSWAVRNDLDSLASKINNWEKRHDNSQMLREIYKKYFEISKSSAPYENPVEGSRRKDQERKTHIKLRCNLSPTRKDPGYDWRLLASIGFNESSFNNDTVSWAGAKGLMQLMPATAKTAGVEPEEPCKSRTLHLRRRFSP